MLNKCQLILATGGTVAQDLTMQWSTMGGFMQELSLLVIDEGQQYGTDREIAVISLLRQQPWSCGQETLSRHLAALIGQLATQNGHDNYC